ncbi:hypothetical protein CWE13_11350 [Aliidiomarina shirensis]|uniref:Uncharacterized protein n=1 Tax=Aliidiomarina shirensis TaxID=1048642 RepID=A0A432WP54_9GAMM|nr:hypothetical protein [Aliidiomarina shirensis]RUO35518.1 hypothetical protein CWE13_11350 [Aliidiomarina shirensis]
MPFEIRQLSWHKRRKPGNEPKPVAVAVPNFKKEANHMCEITVTFDSGEIMQMMGRVLQNPITGAWSINGLNTTGQSVFARYIDEQ